MADEEILGRVERLAREIKEAMDYEAGLSARLDQLETSPNPDQAELDTLRRWNTAADSRSGELRAEYERLLREVESS
jgi:hypothetical protein